MGGFPVTRWSSGGCCGAVRAPIRSLQRSDRALRVVPDAHLWPGRPAIRGSGSPAPCRGWRVRRPWPTGVPKAVGRVAGAVGRVAGAVGRVAGAVGRRSASCWVGGRCAAVGPVGTTIDPDCPAHPRTRLRSVVSSSSSNGGSQSGTGTRRGIRRSRRAGGPSVPTPPAEEFAGLDCGGMGNAGCVAAGCELAGCEGAGCVVAGCDGASAAGATAAVMINAPFRDREAAATARVESGRGLRR